MPEPLRIVMADDNYLVREGARRLLEDSGDVVVAAAVGSAPELLDAVERLRPAAVLTDIRMPDSQRGPDGRPSMEGIDAAHAIRAAYPRTGVVVLSQYADESYAFELFRDGTAGLAYLLKDRIGEVKDFVAAVGRVADGGSVIDPSIVSTLLARRRDDDPLEQLTPRECDVLELMAQGNSNQGIADELVISLRAVEKYVSSIFAKLELPSTGTESRRVLAVLLFLRS